MKKDYVTIMTGANWNEEMTEKVKDYKYAKQVFLDSENLEDMELITSIQDLLDSENIEDEIEFDKILESNKIFTLKDDVYFSIRRIQYGFKSEKFVIKDCVILFLFPEENEFFKFLNEEYTKSIKVGDIEIHFPEIKRKDAMREKRGQN